MIITIKTNILFKLYSSFLKGLSILMCCFCKTDHLLHVCFAHLADHLAQEGALVLHQRQRRVVLLDLAVVQHQDLVVLDDSVESVRDCDHSSL